MPALQHPAEPEMPQSLEGFGLVRKESARAIAERSFIHFTYERPQLRSHLSEHLLPEPGRLGRHPPSC
eukprot:14954143-Alexandrium_andersonii.AAC.1